MSAPLVVILLWFLLSIFIAAITTTTVAITLDTNVSEDCNNLGVEILRRSKNVTDLLHQSNDAYRTEVLSNCSKPLTTNDSLTKLRESRNANYSKMNGFAFCWSNLHDNFESSIIRNFLWCEFYVDYNTNSYVSVAVRFYCDSDEGTRFVTLTDNTRDDDPDEEPIRIDYGRRCAIGKYVRKSDKSDDRDTEQSFRPFLWVAIGVTSFLVVLCVCYGILALYQKFCTAE